MCGRLSVANLWQAQEQRFSDKAQRQGSRAAFPELDRGLSISGDLCQQEIEPTPTRRAVAYGIIWLASFFGVAFVLVFALCRSKCTLKTAESRMFIEVVARHEPRNMGVNGNLQTVVVCT